MTGGKGVSGLFVNTVTFVIGEPRVHKVSSDLRTAADACSIPFPDRDAVLRYAIIASKERV